ncbi:hypothetical protein T06_13507 [Trichinella sp. T6]|nr:hypothetical protein T06_13507 [Trichinella sp. T6]
MRGKILLLFLILAAFQSLSFKLFNFNWNIFHFIMKKENAKMKNKKLDAMKSIASPKYLLSIHN